ncbi:MAG TPA: hypothetical protein VJR89_12185 [Polyangiales bacterium]|nr:hypothetical protein [Polyangiales bacterium]
MHVVGWDLAGGSIGADAEMRRWLDVGQQLRKIAGLRRSPKALCPDLQVRRNDIELGREAREDYRGVVGRHDLEHLEQTQQ